MARRRVYIPLTLRDDSNNITTTASGVSASIIKAGALVNAPKTIGGASSTTCDVSWPGMLANGDSVQVFKTDGTIESQVFAITADPSFNAANGDWTLSFDVTGAGNTVDLVKGDWIMLVASDSSELDAYDNARLDDIGTGSPINPIANPVPLGTSGELTFYLRESRAALYLTGNGITNTYYPDIETDDVPAVDVGMFGAVGDDSNDDTLAIQKAVDCAAALGGGAVLFPAGTYRVTATILFNGGGIHLRGEGNSSIIKADATSNSWTSGRLIDFGSQANCTLSELKIDGNTNANLTDIIHIANASADNNKVRHCWIRNASSANGVLINTMAIGAVVDSCYIEGVNIGVSVGSGASLAVICNSTIDSNTTSGVTVASGASETRVIGCHIADAGGAADISDNADDSLIIGCHPFIQSTYSQARTETGTAQSAVTVKDSTAVWVATATSASIDTFSGAKSGRILHVVNKAGSQISLVNSGSSVNTVFCRSGVSSINVPDNDSVTLIAYDEGGNLVWHKVDSFSNILDVNTEYLGIPVKANPDPTGADGRVYYNSTDNSLKYATDTTWRTAVNTDETQTLTNKTLTSPTITSADLTADNNKYRQRKTWFWRADNSGTMGTNDFDGGVTLLDVDRAITITKIRIRLYGVTPTFTADFRYSTDRSLGDTGGTAVIASPTSSSEAANNAESTGHTITSFDNAAIPANSVLWVEDDAGPGGTTTEIAITIWWDED